ncbi:MAG: hypothetical protein JSV31_09725 [Desulfobacterales bacterium]|nr:MAG: hypothetical protein JSV31_09725 [Desulfobacterales bacterium]
MDQQRQKSIQRKTEAIFKKAEDRQKAGGDYFESGWQATLELMLLMMEEQLLESPGLLLPMQISDDDEWDFYLDVMEKLDLPAHTGAVLVTPSAFKEMKLPEFSEFEDSEIAPWKRNAYSLIISHLRDHTLILQASLPGIEFAGIDIFEDGKHFADYMYNTVEECLDDLSNVTWTYFRPKGDWSKDRIIRYTENWHGKSLYGVEGPDVKFHTEYSYVHNPELIDLTPLHAVFKLIKATVPKEYETLERAIEITNDLSRDMDLGEPVVTKAGIMRDEQAQCQALINRITVEIDTNLEMLSYQKGVKMPDRNIRNLDYNRVFDETVRNIYEVITGRGCPESVMVM